MHAPSLNKLASESVIFERTYVTHPVCTPSRSSLMTGTWPHTNGCTHNSVPLDRRFQIFPELMEDNDYRTAYMGKWHLGEDGPAYAEASAGRPAGRGFQQWISTEDHGDYTKFLISNGIAPDKSNGRFSEVAISNLPIELSRPKFLEKHACDFIERHQRDPFILVVAFVEPHSPYNGPLNEEHPLDDVELDLTATLPESEDIPLRYRLMREWQQAEALLDRERLPIQLFFGITPDEYRSIKQRYLGLVTLVDQSIGAILGCLERCGLTERHDRGAHERPRRQPRCASSIRERNDVRRSRACSVADSIARPNAKQNDFATGKPYRFRADAAGSSRPAKSSAMCRQKSAATDQ